ncbi:MAG: endonuclease/exonuclease/phosphatase family protein [Paracoccaceae bacterium]
MLRDITRNTDDVAAARDTLRHVDADIVALFDFDHDLDSLALDAFADGLYPHRFALPPNTGVPSGVDLDGDGREGGPGDALGWGRFRGAGGMALLSRFPLEAGSVQDWSALRWDDLPDARVPMLDGRVFPSQAARDVLPLASVGIWDVPIRIGAQTVTLHLSHATPPAFDGPEGRNRLRNADEIAFWVHRLNGSLAPAIRAPAVILCLCNADPARGDANREQVTALLTHPAIRDPRPTGLHPGLGRDDTATGNWPEGPGALRTDYILPTQDIEVTASGVYWPSQTSAHGIVWMDLRISDA